VSQVSGPLVFLPIDSSFLRLVSTPAVVSSTPTAWSRRSPDPLGVLSREVPRQHPVSDHGCSGCLVFLRVRRFDRSCGRSFAHANRPCDRWLDRLLARLLRA